MTTTAHEDQFTDAPEPVHQPYDTGFVLRRNVADLELALKQQAERAEAAEAELLAVREDNHSMMLEIDGLRKELAKMREQEPVAWMHDKDGRVDTCHDSVKELWIKVGQKQNTRFMREIVPCRVEHYNIPLYAAPVPAAPRKYHEFASVMLDAQPFITAETYGGRYIVAMRFERLGKMQDCHAALLALLQSTEVTK